jgi:aspartyl-tRNA synthetase
MLLTNKNSIKEVILFPQMKTLKEDAPDNPTPEQQGKNGQ